VRSGWKILVLGWYKKENGRWACKEFEFWCKIPFPKFEALTTYQGLRKNSATGGKGWNSTI
jgi:hypothetical protein